MVPSRGSARATLPDRHAVGFAAGPSASAARAQLAAGTGPPRIGVVSNPGSTRNRKGLPQLSAASAGRAEVRHVVLDDFASIPAALAELAGWPCDLLVVNGGDGTVHRVLTDLLRPAGPFVRLPRIALLCGGMANSIALDIGLPGPPADGFARLLRATEAAAHAPAIVERAVLEVRRGVDDAPHFGFVMGAGAFAETIRLAQPQLGPVGGIDNAAPTLALAYGIVRSLFGKRSGRRFGAIDLRLEADGRVISDGSAVVFVASTLERFMFKLRPFWGDGDGAIRLTVVADPPRRLVGALVHGLRGRSRPWMASAGYRSLRADTLRLRLGGPLVLDGEFLECLPDQTVSVSAERRLQFVRA